MAEEEAALAIKNKGRKETSLKRRAKPGKGAHKSWKRETSRKKELAEYEKSSEDSDDVVIPEIHRSKGSLRHGGGLKWFPTESFVEKFKEKRYNNGISGPHTALTSETKPFRYKTLQPMKEGYGITREVSYYKPSGLVEKV